MGWRVDNNTFEADLWRQLLAIDPRWAPIERALLDQFERTPAGRVVASQKLMDPHDDVLFIGLNATGKQEGDELSHHSITVLLEIRCAGVRVG